MTQQENDNAYFFYMADEDEIVLPATFTVKAHQPVEGGSLMLLGHDKSLEWILNSKGLTVSIYKNTSKYSTKSICMDIKGLKDKIS